MRTIQVGDRVTVSASERPERIVVVVDVQGDVVIYKDELGETYAAFADDVQPAPGR